MPLTRGDAIGYDPDRLSYRFTMMNGIHVVYCEISNVALTDLMGTRWKTVQHGVREAQFLESRDAIEKIASDLFDDAGGQVQSIRIFAKHLPRR